MMLSMLQFKTYIVFTAQQFMVEKKSISKKSVYF